MTRKFPPLTYEEVFDYFKSLGCQLISTEYHNNHELLDYICSCGNPSKISLNNLKLGKRCKKCAKDRGGNQKKFETTYEFVKGFFEYLDCKLITDKYINDRQKLEFICSCGNKDKISFGRLKRGYKCINCCGECNVKNKPYCIEYVKYTVKYFGGELLSDTYEGNNIHIIVQCSCGNIYNALFSSIQKGFKCQRCAYLNHSGVNNPWWEGGLTPLANYIRSNIITQWKKDSIKYCNYKCVLTGKSFNDIHHLYSFNKILRETLGILNLPVKDIRDPINTYSNEELKDIENICLNLHYKYGLGICLKRELHHLFHMEYNYDNTVEQFEEFKQRLKFGEFNWYLKENNLKLII